MADIICRWRNGTPKTVVELVNSLPHNKMTNEAFRQFMQNSIWGNEFFHTPYQLACQLGLYCEAEDGYYHPRFDHDIDEQEAKEYLELWITRYYVPNPYVGKNGFKDITCPTYVLYELYNYAKQHENCTYTEAYESIFQEKPTNNNDIVKNYINNYSKILRFEANGQLIITDINPNTVFDFMDRNNKKEFFENFSKNDNAGTTQTLLVEQNKLTTFVLSTIQYFNKTDGLNAIVPYAGSTSPIKVSKENVFSLVGMFLESTIADVKERNLSHTRWFEDQFTLGERNVFLSTQWNANGDYQLTLDDFIKMIQCCYGTDYIYKTGINGEHQLYLVSKKTNNDLKCNPLQQIYYGAPGTGKSHTINEITKKQPEGNVVRTTFHPDSDYSTFVGAYKPTTKEVAMRDVTGKIIIENGKEVTEDRIVYEFVEQAFLQAYTRAWKLYASAANDTEVQPQYLIIEEINRGNCAQIFGDLFQLLDRGDSGFSEYPIKADNDMKKQLAKSFSSITFLNPDSINQWFEGKDIAQKVLSGEVLLLPMNLYIWATMNTSDQSLFPIDSAFKRRWDWKYVPIADAKKNWIIVAHGNRYDWWQFLDKINTEIEKATHSEDKKLGYFFCKAKNGTIDAETFVGKVVFYLWNDVFKDFVDESGDLFNDEEGRLTFDKFYTIGIDGKTKVVDAKIVRFLQNLAVEPINDEEENDEADGKSQRKETLLSIQIPNHPKMVSSDSTQFDVFVNALKVIGIEKILPLVDTLKYKRLNCPILSKVKYPEIEDNDKFSYYLTDGLYIIKGCNSYPYIRILEDLNEALNIGLTLETK